MDSVHSAPDCFGSSPTFECGSSHCDVEGRRARMHPLHRAHWQVVARCRSPSERERRAAGRTRARVQLQTVRAYVRTLKHVPVRVHTVIRARRARDGVIAHLPYELHVRYARIYRNRIQNSEYRIQNAECRIHYNARQYAALLGAQLVSFFSHH